MNKFIETFILHNEDRIDKNEWAEIYEDLAENYSHSFTSEFTQVLVEAEVFPIKYLSKLPDSYRFNDLKLEVEEIPNNITEIGKNCYQWCVKMHTLIFNTSNLLKIGECAFQFCTALHEVEIPASVKVISDSAFAGTGLDKLILNEGLERIEGRAFLGTHLQEVELPRSLYGLMPNAFPSDCTLKIYRDSDIEQVVRSQRYKIEYLD